MSGSDCYVLRGALLHNATGRVRPQELAHVLTRFVFTTPGGLVSGHCNKRDNVVLQLEVDMFCEHICLAVEK